MQKTLLPTEEIRKKYRTYAPKNWSIKSSTKLLFSRVQRTPSRKGKEMKSGRRQKKKLFLRGVCAGPVDKKHSQGNKNDNSYKVAAGDTTTGQEQRRRWLTRTLSRRLSQFNRCLKSEHS